MMNQDENARRRTWRCMVVPGDGRLPRVTELPLPSGVEDLPEPRPVEPKLGPVRRLVAWALGRIVRLPEFGS
jgi:hypothetical protein